MMAARSLVAKMIRFAIRRRDRLVIKKTGLLATRFGEMFPAIEFEVAYRWAGTFGETKDGLAFIGQIRQMPRCYFALGFGGNGITYSVIAAEIIRGCAPATPEQRRAPGSI